MARVRYEALTVNNSLNSTVLLTFRGDINRDGKVNGQDLAILGARFLATSGQSNYLADADLNHDGVINGIDLAILASNFTGSIA